MQIFYTAGSVVQILIGIELLVSRSGVAGSRVVWDPGRISVLFGWMRLSWCCCLVLFRSFTDLDPIARSTLVFCRPLFFRFSLMLFLFLSGLSISSLLFSDLSYTLIPSPLLSMSAIVFGCFSILSAFWCLNGVCPLVHMGQSLIVQHWTVDPLGGTLVDSLADLANSFVDLASFFFVLVVIGFSTAEDVLPCGAGLGFVSLLVGSEFWFAWWFWSTSLSASLLLFLFGQLFLPGAALVCGGSAFVAAPVFWLGCGYGDVCLGLPGLGLVFNFWWGCFGSVVIGLFGLFKYICSLLAKKKKK